MTKHGSKMETFKAEIVEILYYYDPAGLAKLYVPKDEYSIEAGAIIYGLKDVEDLTSLRWMVYEVFEGWFSGASVLPSSDRCYRYIAEEIWEAWHEIIDEQEKAG